MRGISAWASSAPILVLGGLAAGAAAFEEQKRADCSSLFTTTIFMPTTVYVTAPEPPASSNSASRPSSGTGATTASSSRDLVSSISPSTSEGVTSASVTSSTTAGSSTGSFSSGSETVSFTVTLSTSTTAVEEPTSTQVPTRDPITSSVTSGIISSSVTPTSSAPGAPTIRPPGPPSSPPPIFRGYKNAIYFTNWGTSGNSSYQPQELPVSELTHVLYAFADIDVNGTVKSSDAFADVGKRYARDDPHNRTRGHNAYGVVKQLYLHKKRNRNLKTLLSIGGFDYSPKFIPVAADEARRRVFANSAVKLMADYGFDGIDLDWEYPADAEQGQHFVLLLKACREALDRFSFQHRIPYRFLITVASPAGPVNSHKLDLAGMDPYVDVWNLMAYDYTGSWDNTTGHQSNLYRSPRHPRATKLSTDDAVRYYEGLGIAPSKILLGVPMYGRSFESTAGLGQAYAGVGAEGGGVLLYKTLPRPGARELWDDGAKAAWSYDNATRELVSYDTPRSTLYKARYVRRQRLGGAFFWEARGDRAGAASLVNTMSKSLGWLDQSPNHLWYPMSQYDNIRWGMPGA
ncbi:Chitinase 1 [Apiospora marii]|uniref:Chitinase 1 n=1 Tax=Apiospora marii TaxID=335849 RepID=UPI0031321850